MELFEELIPVWNAFTELDKSRMIGFGMSGLSITDIVAWLDLHEYTDSTYRREIYRLILSLDNKRIEIANEDLGT